MDQEKYHFLDNSVFGHETTLMTNRLWNVFRSFIRHSPTKLCLTLNPGNMSHYYLYPRQRPRSVSGWKEVRVSCPSPTESPESVRGPGTSRPSHRKVRAPVHKGIPSWLGNCLQGGLDRRRLNSGSERSDWREVFLPLRKVLHSSRRKTDSK